MAVFYFIKPLLILTSFVQGIEDTSPIPNHYRIYNLIPQGICRLRRIPIFDNLLASSEIIPLGEQGAMLWQVWNSSSFKRFSDCKFYLQAPVNAGLYLIVNKAQLRKNDRGHCLDNILIKTSFDKKFQFCDAQDIQNNKPRIYSDERGRMRITINLDNTLPLSNLESTLEVQLLATTKRNCDHAGDHEPCDIQDNNSCISKHLFGDGFINCPGCVDEMGCVKDVVPISTLNTSNVFLSAVISLLATMAVFGGCLWCLYKFRSCVSNCNNSTASTPNSQAATATHQIPMNIQPSVMNTTATLTDDKDLPPSYESLFPINLERPNS